MIFFWAMLLVPQVVAQQTDALEVMERVEAGFRKAGCLRVDFSVRMASGRYAGSIDLKGEKFVLRTGGVTTWFDGRTQWSYLESAGEVNISEPTPDELQSLNPYAWLSLYRNGYRVQSCQPDRVGRYGVLLTATDEVEGSVSSIRLYVSRATGRPERIVLQQGGEDVEITVDAYREGFSWADSYFTFDASRHPGVEVIDLR